MREKLIELQKSCCNIETKDCQPDCFGCMADHLIASGVVVSKMETTTKWIPVTERLPEKNRRVLVADNREHYVDLWRFIGNGWIGEEGHYFATEEVTHWMPLPEPPKGE